MTTSEAIKELQYYQKWRRGADIQIPDTKKVGEAIDIAINLMKGIK